MTVQLNPDDHKLVVLARAALARVGAAAGAAVRDNTGRTYTGVEVALPSLRLSAIEVAVSQAVASGAERLDALAIAGNEKLGIAAAAELGCHTVIQADSDGNLLTIDEMS